MAGLLGCFLGEELLSAWGLLFWWGNCNGVKSLGAREVMIIGEGFLERAENGK